MKRTIAAGLSAALLCGMVVPVFTAGTTPATTLSRSTQLLPSEAVKLTFDSLGHRELRVIKGIARVLRDKVIDGQHFIGEGFTGRVKEGHELIADAVCNGNAKGIEIFRNIVDFLEPIRKARNSAGDLDVPGLQAFLQHLHNIFVLWFQCQHPCVDPLFLRNDLQLLEISAVLERCEYIVLKRGDERHCCFVVQFLEQARTISFRAEDVAFAWLLRFLRRSFFTAVLPVIYRRVFILLRCFFLGVICCHERCHGVYAVMGDLTLIPFQLALQFPHYIILGGLYGSAAINSVCHSPHHLGISTEADRADHASFLVCVKHDCICVGRQPDLRRRIIIPQLDQLAL